jgi:hypothetical protein
MLIIEQVVNLGQQLPNHVPVQVFPSSRRAYAALVDILRHRPAKVVKMIQFTGYAAHSFIEQLGDNSPGAQVQILLQHREVAGTFDIGKLSHISNIDATVNRLKLDLKGKLDVDLKYYKTPASVAAILVDSDLLAISWYRYYKNGDGPRTVLIRGHNVASILVRGLAGRDLRQMAEEHFAAVWKDAEP